MFAEVIPDEICRRLEKIYLKNMIDYIRLDNIFTSPKFLFLDIWYWRRLKGDFTLPRGIEVFGIRGQYHIPSEVKLNSSYLTL
jgi:hypothetical protein